MSEEIKEILFNLEIVARKHTIKVCEDGEKIETMPASVVDELSLNNYSAKLLLDYITNLQNYAEKEERLLLIIKAIKKQCDVTENYEMNEFIRQLEKEPVDSKWLKRVAGDDKI